MFSFVAGRGACAWGFTIKLVVFGFFQKTASFSVSGARPWHSRVMFLREAFAQLCVQFRGWAWRVRLGLYDHARFLCRALAAKMPGVLAGALLQRLALERRGWGCGHRSPQSHTILTWDADPPSQVDFACVPPGTLRLSVIG